MKTLEMAKAKAPLMDYARDVEKGPVILTKNGKPFAALVSIKQSDLETIRLSANPTFQKIITRSRSHLKSKGGITENEMRKRLDSST
ncbi:type II toxin-antitoxin system prevent-host-death family antitoxin [Candidatus Sumerlaeota bacterium]|nr:type II toxin-antitoxin system prevent-host-death family antitoxin [Candidatus Sumerlaeota bacterium]